jgi:lipid II:glycine glycyltransferase (peptidoglycan interpeptide bridge formation enzyme)
MLSLITHRFPFFKKKEIWFYTGEPEKETAYTSYCCVKRNFDRPFENELKEITSIIDLTQSEKELFGAIHRTSRYHIRKAERLEFQFDSFLNPSPEVCRKLISSFRVFARFKNIPPMNSGRIMALQKLNHLIITTLTKKNKEILTHVYLFDEDRVILLHTFHDLSFKDAAVRGAANKYLHWKDILLFKEMNFKVYDFGGINPEKVPGITKFKLSFGGKNEQANSYTRIAHPYKILFKLFRLIFPG